MGKLFKLIHCRSNASNADFISTKERMAEVYDRFVTQNVHRSIFYVALNGIAMPVVS